MYQVFFASRRVEKSFESFHPHLQERLTDAIEKLRHNPRPPGVKMLHGEMRGAWRLRVGDYRILYDIDDKSKKVILLEIAHRREIYLRG